MASHDRRLRQLERRAAQGDPEAATALGIAKCRAGDHSLWPVPVERGHVLVRTCMRCGVEATEGRWPVASNPVEFRMDKNTLYRGVSPWEMQRILEHGEVYGGGGADSREECQTFFAENIESAIHHGLAYFRHYLWFFPETNLAFAVARQASVARVALHRHMKGLRKFSRDWTKASKLKREVEDLDQKIRHSILDAGYKATGVAIRSAKKFRANHYVVELHGVGGGNRYTGADNHGGRGDSEVCFDPSAVIPLDETSVVHFFKDETLVGSKLASELHPEDIRIPKASTRKLLLASEAALEEELDVQWFAHLAQKLIDSGQASTNPPAKLPPIPAHKDSGKTWGKMWAAAEQVETSLSSGHTSPAHALAWVKNAYRKGWSEFELWALESAALQALVLGPIIAEAQASGATSAQLRPTRPGTATGSVIVHPSNRPGYDYQVSAFGLDMTPWGHLDHKGGLESALRLAWHEHGKLELVALGN